MTERHETALRILQEHSLLLGDYPALRRYVFLHTSVTIEYEKSVDAQIANRHPEIVPAVAKMNTVWDKFHHTHLKFIELACEAPDEEIRLQILTVLDKEIQETVEVLVSNNVLVGKPTLRSVKSPP
jgi:hypothetical protein